MNQPIQDKVWLITGCSTGFGRVLAEEAAKTGDRVVATARSADRLKDLADKYSQKVIALPLDVTDRAEIGAAVGQVINRFERIDVLVNNAGYGLSGVIEEISLDELRQQFETNVFGLIAVTQAALPYLREQRSGHIINLSSVGGIVARGGFGAYASTKFAVEAISEALAEELKSFGIHVTAVEPGPFRTDFAGRSLKYPRKPIQAYEEPLAAVRQWMRQLDGTQEGDPAKAAKVIMEVVNCSEPPLHLPLGRMARERILAKFERFRGEVDAWREKIDSTDFDPS
jgi:NAD(P)-dependent dehydrogenase (short-subunit alcohol dehydrogenase family)